MDELSLIDRVSREALCLEIAPYFNPRLHKSDRNVLYTDYVDNKEIAKRASANPDGAKSNDIPEIDFVWIPGRPLKACAPQGVQFDFVLAAHVVEHVPDPIGWLNDILSVTKVGGKLMLYVPDKNDTSDYYRPETTLSDLVGAYVERRVIPTSAQIFDFMSLCVEDYGVHPKMFGPGFSFEGVKRNYSDKETVNTTLHSFKHQYYVDIHCTVWTSKCFVEVFRQAVRYGFMNVEISDAIVTHPGEFIVYFTKLGSPSVVLPPKAPTGLAKFDILWLKTVLKRTPIIGPVGVWLKKKLS